MQSAVELEAPAAVKNESEQETTSAASDNRTPAETEKPAEHDETAVQMPARRDLSIFFNDEPFFLPGKETGEPYYLMDLLEYSGIDFKNLNRRVRMEVNGQECGFQAALQQGDHVMIRPE